jgi:hypothetical protein
MGRMMARYQTRTCHSVISTHLLLVAVHFLSGALLMNVPRLSNCLQRTRHARFGFLNNLSIF